VLAVTGAVLPFVLVVAAGWVGWRAIQRLRGRAVPASG
jgi:hypothetical protein